MYEKATPVFIDSEPESWNMSPEALEKAFNWIEKKGKMPKAVIIVNIYGQSADWHKLLPICEFYKVPVIEDAAESLGSTYCGRKTGGFGYFGVFSFNGNKIITTSGGGMVVSDDSNAIKKLRFWATQSKEPVRHYEHKEIGYNYRMSNICAGIGRGQIRSLDERITERKRIYERYREAFSDLPIQMMPILKAGIPNYWLTVITLDNGCGVVPEDIMAALDMENIESRPLWKPMHTQPVFDGYPHFSHYDKENFSENLFSHGVCLPSGSALTEEELDRVISVVLDVMQNSKD
jgi:pyridoxal phosphate-dependent aminotransferase EpsN